MARLEELERKFEENPRRYFAPLANEYRKAGDAQRAAELCRAQLPEIPGHISGHIVLGQALYDARDFPGSRSALETALALDPENIVALRYLGDIARDTGDSAEAERWYSRTLEADPYNEVATASLQALRESASPVKQAGEVDAAAAAAGQATMDSATPVASEEAGTINIEPSTHHPDEPQTNDLQPTTPTHSKTEAPSESLSSITSDAPPMGFEPTPYAAHDEVSRPPEETQAEEELAARDSLEIDTLDDFRPEPDPVAQLEPLAADDPPSHADFAGDLEISAAAEPTEFDQEIPVAETESGDIPEVRPEVSAAAPVDEASVDVRAIEFAEAPVVEPDAPPEPVAEPEAPPEFVAVEETLQTEERVLEAAAPFVTETMADLYMEQGYPHEALELLLQLSEQRPDDEPLRAKIERIESLIVARRDAAVAAARAERAEVTETTEPAEAPFDAAVAEVDASASFGTEPDASLETPNFESGELADLAHVASAEFASETDVPLSKPLLDPLSDPLSEPLSEPRLDESISVREMFARMDKARPRQSGPVTPKPLSRLRSDFVPLPDPQQYSSENSDDPFAFPNQPAQPEERPAIVSRTSGPHPTFDPSTAPIEDFDAWLRGLKGP